MIRTVILDDDMNSQKAAMAALRTYNDIEIVANFKKSKELFAYLQNEVIDLLFLDIELDQELGLEVAKKIKDFYPHILIIFFTGHASYAIDGYDFQPISFLTKPINPIKLERAIENVRNTLNHHQKRRSIQLMFKTMKSHIIINIQDIYYVEHKNRKNFLVTVQGEQRIANYTVKELEKMLEPYGFYCCHQSFIVALNKVQSVNEIERQLYVVRLKDIDEDIPISRHKYKELKMLLRKDSELF